MRTTKIFTKNLAAFNAGEKLIINQGSSRSSKTYSILQLLVLIAIYSKKPLIISIVSRSLPQLKGGALRDLDNILLEEGISVDKIKNKTDTYYKIGNSIIEAFGADQPDRIHGPSRDLLFINEIFYTKFEIYQQLALRTSGTIFLDFNPCGQFWYNLEIESREKFAFIHSVFSDNIYLPEGVKAQLESKLKRYEAETKAGTILSSFKNWCLVYLLGQPGKFEGAIFDNWRYENPGEIEEAFKIFHSGYGLDFGFSPDPDAMTKVAVDRKKKIIYCKECIYANNQGTDELAKQIEKFCSKTDLIIADSAEKRLISDLAKKFNIRRVSKTKDVRFHLRQMLDYEIVITQDSENLSRELTNYAWDDKRAGIPIDAFNHGIDGIRYYWMDRTARRGGIRRVN